jgi:hypothetical protein
MNKIFQQSQKISEKFLVRSSRTQSAKRMKYLDEKGEEVA